MEKAGLKPEGEDDEDEDDDEADPEDFNEDEGEFATSTIGMLGSLLTTRRRTRGR